jgi:hypothetical protein
MTLENLKEFARSLSELCEVLIEESPDHLKIARCSGISEGNIDLEGNAGHDATYYSEQAPCDYYYDVPLETLLMSREEKSGFLKEKFFQETERWRLKIEAYDRRHEAEENQRRVLAAKDFLENLEEKKAKAEEFLRSNGAEAGISFRNPKRRS